MFHKTGGNMSGAASYKPDITLGDYIARKQDKPKLTFEEWFSQSGWAARRKPLTIYPGAFENVYYEIWKAAQENK